MDRVTKSLVSLITWMAVASPVPAQRTIETRSFYVAVDRGDVAGRSVLVSSFYEVGKATRISYLDGSETVLDAPFTFPGSLQQVGNTGDPHFLASGTDGLIAGEPATGVLAVVRMASGQDDPVIEEVRDYTGRDILRSGYASDLGALFIIDGETSSLMAAPWLGVGDPLPDPAEFQPVVTAQQSWVLAEDVLHMRAEADGVVFTLDTGTGARVSSAGGSWVVTPVERARSQPAGEWRVESPRQLDVFGSIEVSLEGEPLPFQVVTLIDSQVVVVASGMHPGGGASISLATTPLMAEHPGQAFYIMSGPENFTSFRPVVIRGQSRGTANLEIARELFLPCEGFFVGVRKLFAPRVGLARNSNTAADYDAWLLFAPHTDGVDPVVDLGGGVFTIPGATTIPFTVSFDEGQREKHVRLPVDVPNVPSLEGTVFSFQYVFDDGAGKVAFTDVRSCSVLGADDAPPLLGGTPPDLGGAARLAVPSGLGALTVGGDPVAREAAVSSWLSNDYPGGVPDPAWFQNLQGKMVQQTR